MNKIESQVHKLLSKISNRIMEEHEVDVSEVIQNIVNKPHKTRCAGHYRNGKPCRCFCVAGQQFCIIHANDTAVPSERSQCVANTADGHRCVRNARPGKDMCGSHIYQETLEKRKPRKFFCLYDKEDNEECTKVAQPGKWVCKKHDKHQDFMTSTFGFASHQEYLDKKEDRHDVVVIDTNIARNF